jgi:polysaccharide biosynthesis/export protein
MLGSAAFALSGCAVARGAPSRKEMIAASNSPDANFVLELVTQERLPLYRQWGPSNGERVTQWLSGDAVVQDQRLAAGDVLALRIWDSEPSSLITPDDARFSDIANITITASGHASLPYVGEVHVDGLTADRARVRLLERLRQIIPSAELQMEVRQGRKNSVDIIGGVANPGSYPLGDRNLALTTLIAAAGGVESGLKNPQVQINRSGQLYRRSLKFILSNARHDPVLYGGDRVLIESDPRRFIGLGASGREDIISFDADIVSALRAIALMGGMADSRADPKGILVLRRYPEESRYRSSPLPHNRIVFSFDLTHASGVFAADEFELHNDDVVMVTQAPATSMQRTLTLLGSTLGFARAAQTL